MASIKQGDTWPPLRGRAEDQDGLIDLTVAEETLVLMKLDATLISGTIEVIDPPDSDGFNWRYTWQDGDTAIIGNGYSVELEVMWDSSATPPQVETIPNGANPTLDIVADLGGTN